MGSFTIANNQRFYCEIKCNESLSKLNPVCAHPVAFSDLTLILVHTEISALMESCPSSYISQKRTGNYFLKEQAVLNSWPPTMLQFVSTKWGPCRSAKNKLCKVLRRIWPLLGMPSKKQTNKLQQNPIYKKKKKRIIRPKERTKWNQWSCHHHLSEKVWLGRW